MTSNEVLSFEEFCGEQRERVERGKRVKEEKEKELSSLSETSEYRLIAAKKKQCEDAMCRLENEPEMKEYGKKVKELEDRIESLNTAQSSLSFLIKMEVVKHALQKSITNGRVDEAVGKLGELKELLFQKDLYDEEEIKIYGEMLWGKAVNDTFNLLKSKFTKQLDLLGWPKPIDPSKWKSRDMETCLSLLDSLLVMGAVCGDANITERAVNILIVPIKIRFMYHFCTDRPTNRIDRPEWFLSHSLQIITDHMGVLQNCFELDVDSSSNTGGSLFRTFIQKIIEMVEGHVEGVKMKNENFLNDSALLIHWVDEIISFEKALTMRINLPENSNGILNQFLDPITFSKWIQALVNINAAALTSIIESSPDFKDETCTEGGGVIFKKFIEMMEDLVDLLFSLPSVTLKLDFLEQVILIICDQFYQSIDFSMPSFYSSREEVNSLIVISNGLHLLCSKISDEWGCQYEALLLASSKLFLERFGYEQEEGGGEVSGMKGSIFHKLHYAFYELYNRSVENLTCYVWQSFQSPISSFIKSMHYGIYRKDSPQLSMHDDLRKSLISITTSHSHLKPHLHSKTMSLIDAFCIDSLSTLLFSRLIMQNFFRPESINQLKSDILTIEQTFTKLMPNQPPLELAFSKVKEAVILLGMGEAEREHLRECLEGEDLEEASNVLSALKINYLSVSECEQVINLIRID